MQWCEHALSGLRNLGLSVLDLCLPVRCAGCQEEWLAWHQGFWCERCLEALPWIRPPSCPQCGRPYPDSPSSPDHLCGECLSSNHLFDSARSATLFAGVVRDRIHQLKFGAHLHWVPALVQLLAVALENVPTAQLDVVLPVPLHVRRVRQRGFNQAGLLAKVLGKRIGLPVNYDVLVRKCWTEPQTRLHRKQRLENVKDAFAALLPAAVEGKTVLLIDDVFTTGTTLSECAKALKAASAAEVHALTVSRAMPDWRPNLCDDLFSDRTEGSSR